MWKTDTLHEHLSVYHKKTIALVTIQTEVNTVLLLRYWTYRNTAEARSRSFSRHTNLHLLPSRLTYCQLLSAASVISDWIARAPATPPIVSVMSQNGPMALIQARNTKSIFFVLSFHVGWLGIHILASQRCKLHPLLSGAFHSFCQGYRFHSILGNRSDPVWGVGTQYSRVV